LKKTGATSLDSVCDRSLGLIPSDSAIAHWLFRFASAAFETVHIPTEVYNEVVIAGARRPGAESVAHASWVKVTPVQSVIDLEKAIEETGLGSGEVGAVQLARELGIKVILIDERKARAHGKAAGLITLGCVGILEMLHRRGALTDLRSAYRLLLEQKFRIDVRTLETSLRDLGLPSL
jgi:predicted nucleic acid-binding protein